MQVFVTGGSGYIGRATLAALRRHGIAASALVRTDRSAEIVAGLGATPVLGTLTDAEVLTGAARASDGVIHLGQAAEADGADIDRTASEAMQAGLGDRGAYVHTGGTWVYGDTDGVVDEDAPQAPPALVAWRAANEKLVLERPGRPVLVMPGLVYGKSGGLLETFYLSAARGGGAVPCVGDGGNHWSTVHVDDIAELYVLALHAPAGSVYAGVAEGYPTQAEVLTAAAREAGLPETLTHLSLPEAVALMGPIAEAFHLDQQVTGARARTALPWLPPS
ncbi:NAD-dependent epimerase/dehydratase family protein [Pseudonocardia spinosispora]|uniref:NAD-dependent epimerase/dehydratase family protein n=1 Tax=Pseudonocardia spinosispora TaxID=103441 RepID=UPI00048D37F6|nr:NAD-dependent epimerase/dehydratase family protein [Pseudonocardia spinosispora]